MSPDGGSPERTEAVAAEGDRAATEQHGTSQLFGRGLLYVVVWSLQLVVSTVVSPVLAHVLGPTEFGSLASAIALFQVLTILSLLGLDQALVLQRAEDGNDKAARGLVAVGIALALVVALLVWVSSPLWLEAFGFGDHPLLVVAVILWTAPAASVQVMLSLLLAEDRLRPFSIISSTAALGGPLVGLVFLVFIHADAVTYAWGGVVSQFTAMAIALIVSRPSLRGLVEWRITWRAMKLGLPLALGSLAYFVLNAGDRVVIQSLLGPAEVGRYQVAYIVGSTVILMLTFTSSAWTPRFAALRDERARFALATETRDELYRLLVPVIIGITFGAPMVLMIVAPASFRPEGLLIVVFVIALSAFPVAASGSTGRLLIIERRGKSLALMSGVAATVNVLFNFVFIPFTGITGAALATLVSYAILAFLQRRLLSKRHPYPRPPARLIVSALLACAIAGGSILLPHDLGWDIARLVVAVACVPWLILRLRAARGAPDTAVVEGAAAPAAPGTAPDSGSL
jgi:O-antigen/teichoic acid export membrane protein